MEADVSYARLGLNGRLHLWRAGMGAPVTGFAHVPEPRTTGQFARGRQLLSGNVLIGGHLIEAPKASLWDVPVPDQRFAVALHGFDWLDDLAALGDGAARARAQAWTRDWFQRFAKGAGPGWSPQVVARRILRLLHHSAFLLAGQGPADQALYFRALTVQTRLLSWLWRKAPPGLPRIEALTGLISALSALEGMAVLCGPAETALAQECAREIDAGGGIPSRCPEELLEVFSLLTWATEALGQAAGRQTPPALAAALGRIAPTLRALRHADGGLARFHGGGRGAEGRLDQSLAASGIRTGPVTRQGGLHMGFARLTGGRTSVIVDAGDPPKGAAGRNAHASTGAFEMTSGRRPVVVSCGSGAPFGEEWRRAGRASASHATLSVDGFSSSRFGAGDPGPFAETAHVSVLRLMPAEDGMGLHMAHDGWGDSHGLSHVRDLFLQADGRRLSGIDKLAALTTGQKRRMAQLMHDGKMEAVAFDLRFHLHPDVDARLEMGGAAISLALKSGEVWVFRHDGSGKLSLDASVYLEKGRLYPRACQQIVLSARAVDFETRLGWTFAKAQDTPLAIRDLDRDEGPGPG